MSSIDFISFMPASGWRLELERREQVQLGSPLYTTPPEETLSRMLREDLNVEVTPQALRMFIRFRWDTISKLAHDIHGCAPTPAQYREEVVKAELEREAKRPTMDADEIARRYRAGEFNPL